MSLVSTSENPNVFYVEDGNKKAGAEPICNIFLVATIFIALRATNENCMAHKKYCCSGFRKKQLCACLFFEHFKCFVPKSAK